MSESSPKLDREKLRAELLEEFETVFQEVADAVDDAPPGRIIRDSEWKVWHAMERLRHKVYESAVQAKVDAAEASFPPSGQPDDGPEDAEQGPTGV